MPLGFQVALDRCTGCGACRLACQVARSGLDKPAWRRVVTENRFREPGAPVRHYSVACNHCEDAPCVRGCPAGALVKRAEDGAVLLETERCLGCRYCEWLCPFGAPAFDAREGVMEKCDLCVSRRDRGEEPACTQACPTGALTLAEWTENRAHRPRGFDAPWARPAYEFTPGAERRAPPRCTPKEDRHEATRFSAPKRDRRRIDVTREWPLVLLTWAVPALVAAAAAALIAVLGDADRVISSALRPGDTARLGAAALIGLAVLVASTAHLGRPVRFAGAARGFARSWLSREVALTGLFVGAIGAAALGIGGGWGVLFGVLFGALALLSIDRVYGAVATDASLETVSSSALVTGGFLLGVFSDAPLVFLTLGGLKLTVHLCAALSRSGAHDRTDRALIAARIGIGLAAPLAFEVFGGGTLDTWAVSAVLTGELADRVLFYRRLEIDTLEARLDGARG